MYDDVTYVYIQCRHVYDDVTNVYIQCRHLEALIEEEYVRAAALAIHSVYDDVTYVYDDGHMCIFSAGIWKR